MVHKTNCSPLYLHGHYTVTHRTETYLTGTVIRWSGQKWGKEENFSDLEGWASKAAALTTITEIYWPEESSKKRWPLSVQNTPNHVMISMVGPTANMGWTVMQRTMIRTTTSPK